jgi:ABC-type amino acid transport substrate-binding protein
VAGLGAWDIALPSASVTTDAFAQTAPYYHWPIWLMAPAATTATSPRELTGSTICVVAGSAGAHWLDGSVAGTSASPAVAPPRPAAVHTSPTDDACAAEVAAGTATAFVTAGWSEADLATRPALRRVGAPVLTEARAVIAVRRGPDPEALVAEVDRALAAMRDDGTLAHFSQSRFGGLDLTGASTP